MRSLRAAIASVGVTVSLVGCGSTPPPATVQPSHPGPMVMATPEPSATTDLSAVPTPDALLATIRITSPRHLAERLGTLLGMHNGLVQSLDQALPGIFGDDEAMAHAVDLSGPADLVLYRREGARDPVLVVSFSTIALQRAESSLSDGHRLVPGVNGMHRVEATTPGHTGGVECILAPAAGGDGTGAGRMVCGQHVADAEPMVAYVTRTLPRSPVDPTTEDIVAELAASQVRATSMGDARAAADEMVRQLTPPADPNNPTYQQSVTEWARDIATSYPMALTDLASGRLAVSLPATGAEVSADVGLQGTSAPLVRQLLDAVRDQHPPADQTAHLPVGGFGYTAVALGLEPFRASLNVAASVVAANIVPHSHLQAPDNTALRTAIAALFAQDRVSTAAAIGADAQGHPWIATAFQVTTPPAQFIANARALVAAIKRPLVARAIMADHHEDVSRWTLVPTGAGIPAGSLLVRMPPRVASPTPSRPGLHGSTPPPPPAPRRPTELLLVPDGATVWLSLGADAREVYRAALAVHPAPLPTSALSGEGVAAALGIVPAGLQGIFRDDHAMSQVITRMVHDAQDHGQTPATLAFTTGQRDGATHLGLRLQLPAQVVQTIGATLLPAGGHP